MIYSQAMFEYLGVIIDAEHQVHSNLSIIPYRDDEFKSLNGGQTKAMLREISETTEK